ncbi:MAG: lytic transglycosylase F [Draconibacterium sp.]|nr:MAG: lytic transglycosylase F [Draconibacterium sp.]
MNFFSKNNKLKARLLIFFISVFLLTGCHVKQKRDKAVLQEDADKGVLEHIRERGVLNTLVDYNSTNYFVYRGRPMGFQYELLQQLCKDLGVSLNLTVINNLDETFEGIKSGKYDLVAKNLTVSRQRSKEVDFTVPLQYTRQVLVQRNKKTKSLDTVYIGSVSELAGKTIYVQKNTVYYRRLQFLAKKIGKKINIVQDSIYGFEELVAQVADGDIDYTVCDENIAILNKTYYPNIDVSLWLSFPEKTAWAIKKGAIEWKKYLDNWITEFRGTRQYRVLYHRYFESPGIAQRLESNYHSLSGGRISVYDELIKSKSKKYGWDWRLVAAIIYNESNFNVEAESWAGACGLMQLLPSTAESLGVENYELPDQNIKAGLLYLNWLDRQLLEAVPDSTERINFILAAYNIGLGHVEDACRLAEKYGKDMQKWEGNVDEYLAKKSMSVYYKDSVVRAGYCRGEDAVKYVEKVKNLYKHYVNAIAEN